MEFKCSTSWKSSSWTSSRWRRCRIGVSWRFFPSRCCQHICQSAFALQCTELYTIVLHVMIIMMMGVVEMVIISCCQHIYGQTAFPMHCTLLKWYSLAWNKKQFHKQFTRLVRNHSIPCFKSLLKDGTRAPSGFDFKKLSTKCSSVLSFSSRVASIWSPSLVYNF